MLQPQQLGKCKLACRPEDFGSLMPFVNGWHIEENLSDPPDLTIGRRE
jgi:hypothetical protein